MKVFPQVFLLLAVSILSTCDKNNDESRPYEFGFTIDGQQHRNEKKDDKGIIQGEFGFITADGIYHVTVYATDENGNFKILSMKNLRISAPLDGSPQTGPLSPEAGKYLNKVPQAAQQPQKPAPQPEPLSIPEQPVQPQLQPQPQQPVTTQKPKVNYPFTTQPTIKPACAGCGYVTTPKPIPGQPFPFQNSIFKQQDSQNQAGQQSTGSQFEGGTQGQNGPQGQQNGQQDVDYQSQQGGQFNFQNTKTETIETSKQQTIQGQGFIGSQGQGGQTGPVGGVQAGGQFGGQSVGQIGGQGGQFGGQSGGAGGQINGQGGQFGGQPGQVGGQVQAGGPPNPNPLGIDIPAGSPGPLAQNGQNYTPFPPVAVQDNVINVGGKTPQQIPIRDKFPGMQDGLPEGIEEKDIKDLLYKFHYTVGFHGHYEKGLKNGAKIGGYFVNGRDGISRVVTYVADENGYRAKTKLINLGLDSDETPKEATEKTFGLKSFEFVWYPVE